MPINREWYRTVASMLSPESAEEYWQIIGRLDRLSEDDEMRIVVNISAATTAAALRSNAETVARLEETWREISLMFAASEARHSELTAILAAATRQYEETYGLAMTRTRVLKLMQSVRESLEGEFVAFLSGLSTERLRDFVDEVKRGEQAFKDIDSHSTELRKYLSSMVPEMRGLTKRMAGTIDQMGRVIHELPPKSWWTQNWFIVAALATFLIGVCLAFWVGRHFPQS